MKQQLFKLFKLLSPLVLLAVFTVPRAAAEPVWIDVRTVEEYAGDHIAGDANIPLAELDAAQLATSYASDAEIMLYCRSGNRAAQAKELLEAAGFTNVVNAGGITDVRALREIAAGNASGATSASGAVSAAPR